MLNKRELAEYTIRPLGLTPEMQDRMINRLIKLSDEDLANNFTKSNQIKVDIISAGKFMFKY
jgi:hypothetical protein